MPAPQNHPPGCYYANPITISVQRQCNPLLAASLGLAGYFGQDGLPATFHNAFPQFEQALEWAKSAHGGVTPGGVPGPGNPSVGNPLTGVNAIGDFFTRLTEPHTWVRVGEFIAGGIILWVGLNALLRGTAAGQAIQQTKSGVKKAATVVK
jgi:hypothetical protein